MMSDSNTHSLTFPAASPVLPLSTTRIFDAEAKRTELFQLCKFQLFATILMSRLAIPMGAKQIQMTWIVGMVFFFLIGRKAGWAVSGLRLTAITLLALITVYESTYFHYAFSPLSLIYLFGIYGPLCLTLPALRPEDVHEIWKSYLKLSIGMAICGLIQVAGQIVAGGFFLDPLSWLPEGLQLSGYTTFYKSSLGPFTYIKPNGMVALEPSFFSQFIALGLVAELHYYRRLKVFCLLLAALLATFAGTGLLILVLALPFIKHSPKWILLMLVAALVWTVALGDKATSFYSQRISEFNHPGASGNARFILPYQLMAQHWTSSTKELLVGIGAGQSSVVQESFFEANDPPVVKIGIEFGLIGLAAFVVYWVGASRRLAVPACTQAALFVFYFVSAGALLHPPTVFPIWALTLGFLPSAKKSASLEKA